MSKSHCGENVKSPEARGLDGVGNSYTPVRGDETKFDGGKLLWDLLPWDAVEKVVEIQTYGADKYTEDGWKTVPNAERRYFAALMRHLVAEKNGETYDKESGNLHLAHVATNALFLLWFKLQKESK